MQTGSVENDLHRFRRLPASNGSGMNWRPKLAACWRSALAGGALCVAVGWALLWFGGWPVFLGYDLLFWFRHAPSTDDVVIVYLDDKSFQDLGQTSAPNWDRNLHAQLLDRLTRDECPLVVFDIVFSEPGTPEANTNLANAIRRHGNVVLAAALNHPARAQILVKQPLLPLPEFLDAAAGWGMAEVDMHLSPGRVARRYFAGTEHQPSLAWSAARAAGAEVTAIPGAHERNRWLNYYGPALALPHVGFSEVIDQPAGWFSNKVVFVGARPTTLKAHEEADQFRTPHTLWTGEYSPGVEIGATAFLNLTRSDGLERWSARNEFEWWLVLLAGLTLGGALSLSRPLVAGGLAFLAAALFLVLALHLARQHVWYPWTVVAFAQIPAALAWSLRCHFHRLRFEKDVLERTLTETTRWTEAASASAAKARETDLVIPDHTLVRPVGKGAYGEVWLARNAIGLYHAVKIVKRQAFPNDDPYEREFRGIQSFMPVSRSHPGLVHVLHVGRNDQAGFFFSIMEAADDRTSGRAIDPERYAPRTLATDLASRQKLPLEECLNLGIALAMALEHLHRERLIHRDIKPGNIIYVNGAPKFADIGLVTDLRGPAQPISLVGTEGYVPPEGPGTPGADVYALGKVLYEAGMGRDRDLFPEVPTTVWEQPEDAPLRQLYEVIWKACDPSVKSRFNSATELRAALTQLRGNQK
jgi:CHASE2 domain-containing sensor protein